jgi:hypothetical protein
MRGAPIGKIDNQSGQPQNGPGRQPEQFAWPAPRSGHRREFVVRWAATPNAAAHRSEQPESFDLEGQVLEHAVALDKQSHGIAA